MWKLLLMELAAMVVFLSLSITLLAGAISKVRALDSFVGVLYSYELGSLPVTVVATTWVALEIVAAVVLWIPVPFRSLPALAVMGLATGAVAKRRLQHKRHNCGCGLGPKEVGVERLVINLAMVGLLILAAGLTTSRAQLTLLLAGGGVSMLLGATIVGRSVGTDAVGPQLPMSAQV